MNLVIIPNECFFYTFLFHLYSSVLLLFRCLPNLVLLLAASEIRITKCFFAWCQILSTFLVFLFLNFNFFKGFCLLCFIYLDFISVSLLQFLLVYSSGFYSKNIRVTAVFYCLIVLFSNLLPFYVLCHSPRISCYYILVDFVVFSYFSCSCFYTWFYILIIRVHLFQCLTFKYKMIIYFSLHIYLVFSCRLVYIVFLL